MGKEQQPPLSEEGADWLSLWLGALCSVLSQRWPLVALRNWCAIILCALFCPGGGVLEHGSLSFNHQILGSFQSLPRCWCLEDSGFSGFSQGHWFSVSVFGCLNSDRHVTDWLPTMCKQLPANKNYLDSNFSCERLRNPGLHYKPGNDPFLRSHLHCGRPSRSKGNESKKRMCMYLSIQ